MKKFIHLLTLCCLFYSTTIFGQVGIGTSTPDPSSILELQSTNKGFLMPRLTLAQIGAIPGPANGLVVFCTTDSKFYAFVANINTWQEILYGTGLIAPPFTCGSLLSIYHVAGAVAPVNKMVTYGTVTNIPGETSKCWITSNLGASRQATDVNDASEAPAGWYWQFNRMQGYKHDGPNRTPNTTWITSINENSDWLTANDPCALLLGTGWRLPTSTEWYNVDESGGWTNWNDPWDSGLKMHAAGYLYGGDGSLSYRGSDGDYWNSSQDDNTYGWNLFFDSGNSVMVSNGKASAFSTRCLRD